MMMTLCYYNILAPYCFGWYIGLFELLAFDLRRGIAPQHYRSHAHNHSIASWYRYIERCIEASVQHEDRGGSRELRQDLGHLVVGVGGRRRLQHHHVA